MKPESYNTNRVQRRRWHGIKHPTSMENFIEQAQKKMLSEARPTNPHLKYPKRSTKGLFKKV